ncbi:MAG: hypothetical protein RSA12_02500, partial [Clostridia bacterium]
LTRPAFNLAYSHHSRCALFAIPFSGSASSIQAYYDCFSLFISLSLPLFARLNAAAAFNLAILRFL